MSTHRTPDDRFADLADYPYAANYSTVGDGLRLHYVDEGPREATPVLMMHGEPTWSYLYRNMIGPVVDAGYRVLAPDLIGFGKSDKPTDRDVFSYAGHVAWMREWFEGLDLTGVVLACQDWGSLIGLRLVAAMPDRFAAVVLANGGLPAGQEPPEAFAKWREFSQKSPVFPIGQLIQGGTTTVLPDAVVAAYDAPFDIEDSKAAARVFPCARPAGRECRRAGPEGGVGRARRIRQALHLLLQRRGRHNQGRRTRLHGARARSQGPRPAPHAEGRPLHPGRRSAGLCRGHPRYRPVCRRVSACAN